MKEQQKAEAYVRSQLPELMELSFGCEVAHIPSGELGIWYTGYYVETSPRKSKKDMHVIYFPSERPFANEYTVTLERRNFEVVGQPIRLEHWLRVLEPYDAKWSYTMCLHLGQLLLGASTVEFNLTTGQPATEADYQAFNKIVGNNTL